MSRVKFLNKVFRSLAIYFAFVLLCFGFLALVFFLFFIFGFLSLFSSFDSHHKQFLSGLAAVVVAASILIAHGGKGYNGLADKSVQIIRGIF